MRPYSPGRFRASSRQGFTITELLIAATISLILTYAVVQMFDYVASEARYGRASIELASQLRNASRRISTDLACATAPMRPFADRHGQGYFEYLEGPGSDSVALVYDSGTNTFSPSVRTSAIDGTSTVAVETSLGGDIDDILMFTAYNPDEPFRGRYRPSIFDSTAGTWSLGAPQVIESKYAEIAIWTVRAPNGRVNVYRRALLIRPDLTHGFYTSPEFILPATPPFPAYDQLKYRMQSFYQQNDLSIRFDSTAGLVGNTLADLSRRENRFAHVRSNIPNLYPIDADELQQQDPTIDRKHLPYFPGWLLTSDPNETTPVWLPATDTLNDSFLEGNDVLLTEALAFDVKAFDPLASVRLDQNHFAMSPSDPGYDTDQGHTGPLSIAGGKLPLQTGAFVDLGYDLTHAVSPAASSWFIGNGQTKSKLVTPSYFTAGGAQYAFRTYCTWSLFYEMNSLDSNNDGTITVVEGDENGDGIPDGGNNQIDDNNNGVVDELAEWDTAPPYPYPLRGVQVTLRVMEPNSRQVRQMSVVQNFTGE
jgi:type II secretory pathway pseudopilin PulG